MPFIWLLARSHIGLINRFTHRFINVWQVIKNHKKHFQMICHGLERVRGTRDDSETIFPNMVESYFVKCIRCDRCDKSDVTHKSNYENGFRNVESPCMSLPLLLSTSRSLKLYLSLSFFPPPVGPPLFLSLTLHLFLSLPEEYTSRF